ncbi:hypothetical protein BDZ94DRAFT_1260041 [Collybia nuda]|uniref:Uncharacterized protein n=1 Tax=Collybia nuda TaxID=64659 RepID=A0A9P5Y6G7_9AGAR|nr:hypothetical protein BDZ94DRAFT_1260041 [Collybia nuda]
MYLIVGITSILSFYFLYLSWSHILTTHTPSLISHLYQRIYISPHSLTLHISCLPSLSVVPTTKQSFPLNLKAELQCLVLYYISIV